MGQMSGYGVAQAGAECLSLHLAVHHEAALSLLKLHALTCAVDSTQVLRIVL